MTDHDKTRLRLKQDFLLMLAVDMCHYDESLRIDEKNSSPTLANLRPFIHPEWEWAIDAGIRSLANRQLPIVGIPDFDHLAEVVSRGI